MTKTTESNNVLVLKIIDVLKEIGYSDIDFDYQERHIFYFDVYLDATMQVRVEVDSNKEKCSVYDLYMGDKHFSFIGDYPI